MRPDQKVIDTSLTSGFFAADFQIWAAYVPLTERYWGRFPELLCGGFTLTILEPQARDWRPALKSTFENTLHFISRARAADFSAVPRCDVCLFRSTIKPSTDAVFILAEELAQSGIACATLLTAREMTIWRGAASAQDIPGYTQWMNHGLSRSQAISTILRTIGLCLLLTFLAIFKSRTVLRRLYSNPFGVWNRLLMTTHRLQVMKRLLAHMKPRLIIVNNERVPVAGELMQARTSHPVERILFCNELPSIMLDPTIADTVWVWNDLAAEQVKAAIRHGKCPSFEVVGHSETEVALHYKPDAGSDLSDLQQEIGAKPVLLFLSEYIPSKVFDLSAASQLAFEWIKLAARQFPNWHFVVKTRPAQAKLKIPGIDMFDSLPNVSISETADLKTLLSYEQVQVVAALGSTGLMTAAGVGKTALRFWTPPRYGKVAVIDAISIPIRSGQELIQFLGNFTQNRPDESLFAYRGQTIQRMKQLCLERLADKEV